MTYKLASGATILELKPIPGADKIELAVITTDGHDRWHGVVQKGGFSIGQVVAAFFHDAQLPPSEDYAFLKKNNWRIKIVTLRGQRSEVLILPAKDGIEQGDDLTDLYEVTKYDKPIPAGMTGDVVGPLVYPLVKTDEPLFQGVPHLVEALKGQPYVATLKYDGTSFTAARIDGRLRIFGRNWEYADGPNAFWNAAREYHLEDTLQNERAIQAELYGPGINGNRLQATTKRIAVFNVFDLSTRSFYDYAQARMFCDDYEIPFVDTVLNGHVFDMTPELMLFNAQSTLLDGKDIEGLVFRPKVEQRVNGERLSFKVINPGY